MEFNARMNAVLGSIKGARLDNLELIKAKINGDALAFELWRSRRDDWVQNARIFNIECDIERAAFIELNDAEEF